MRGEFGEKRASFVHLLGRASGCSHLRLSKTDLNASWAFSLSLFFPPKSPIIRVSSLKTRMELLKSKKPKSRANSQAASSASDISSKTKLKPKGKSNLAAAMALAARGKKK